MHIDYSSAPQPQLIPLHRGPDNPAGQAARQAGAAPAKPPAEASGQPEPCCNCGKGCSNK